MQLLRILAFPLSLIYGMVVTLRNLLYDWQWFSSQSFATPIIIIGNLSVGGTGKTPMVEFLVRRLQSDYQLAILSRGYRRKSKGFHLAHSESTVEVLGDEPFQLFQKFSEVHVAVDANRRNGIAQLEDKVAPNVILMDDAFQHRRVSPHFSILVTTFSQPFSSDWYLPTGNLRDSKKQAERADVIVVTKCPDTASPESMALLKKRLQTNKVQKVLFAKIAYDDVLVSAFEKVKLAECKDRQVALVTGIANPEPLVAYLKDVGLQFTHHKFPDHHFFSEKELSLFRGKEMVLTTEKDYVRLAGKVENLFYLGIRHDFFGDGAQELMVCIDEAITNSCPPLP